MDDALPLQQPLLGAVGRGSPWPTQHFKQTLRQTMAGNAPELLAVVGRQAPVRSAAKAHGLFEHRVEYRRDIAGRGIDDLEDFGGRSLLLQRLARLSYQTCILNRDHRLRREVLDKRDLLVGKWSH